MFLKNKAFFWIVILLSSCRSELDPDVWNRYFELSQAQDWFDERVLQIGLDRIENQVDERGRLHADVAVLEEIKSEFQDYYLTSNLISQSIEKRLDYNGKLLQVILEDSIAPIIDEEGKNWMLERGIEPSFKLGQNETDWLLFELKFREIGLTHLQKKLSEAFWKMQQPKISYWDSTTVIREVFHSYDKVEVNGKLLDLDSLGIFQLPKERPVTVTIPRDQKIYRIAVESDTEFVIN